MASNLNFIEFVCEQINELGNVRYKKMFGEYMVYLNDKPIFTICDDTVFVKILPIITQLLGEDYEQGSPYNGAKPHYVISDIENKDFMQSLAQALEEVTPIPKPKKKKS